MAYIARHYLMKQNPNSDMLLTYISLLCQGKTQYDVVREMDDDPEFYRLALGLKGGIPSAETLRQRLDEIGGSLHGDILRADVEALRQTGAEPSALECGYVPVNVDVTPLDNSKTGKDGVSRTHKGFDGYAPIMAYVGTEGYLVNVELREGRQHCQNGTARFLRETIGLCKRLTDKQFHNELKSDMSVERFDGFWTVLGETLYFLVESHGFR